MAEMAVSAAKNLLLPLVKEEVYLLKGFHKEFADIEDELESIQAFLKDADTKAAAEGENEGIKTWVKQVIEAAFRIEDIIDEYMIYWGQQRRDPGCAALLAEIAHFIKTLIHRHRIASEIRDIKSRLREINERSKSYSFQIQPSFEQGSSSSGGSPNVKWHDPRTASLYVEDAELVGFEAPRDKLIGWLLEGPEERSVISVVGMGGVGKTTLASRVFNNQKVIGHFDCHAWITVSRSYTVEGLLRDMLKEFCKEKKENPPQGISEMNRDSLIKEVRNYLQQKRYVVVFDDVWHVHFWNEIECAVVDNKMGSKIFITTRNIDVAMSCKISSFVQVHELQPLTAEKSLELFYKKAFRDLNGCCPDDLVDISSEIVKKCYGLPLTIVAIGGLLSCKEKNASEWGRFFLNLRTELEKDSRTSAITTILRFSYDDLPDYLKSCLLYFGMYPEDYEVRSKRLIRQWIAEGFVNYEKGITLEKVAEQYITELVCRSLVQVSSVTIEGKVKSCRVHDLTREMILRKCKDLCFCEYISEDNKSMSSGIIRRQSIATSSSDFIESTESSHVRSLLFFNRRELSDDCVTKLPKKYKLLKVLDFGDGVNFDYCPENLLSLIYMTLLTFWRLGEPIKSLSIKSLPKSLGELKNLEYLNLYTTKISILPKEICKLKKLRYLLGKYMSLIEVKDGIGGMTSLQTLNNVCIPDYGAEVIRELGNLKLLRNLGLYDINPELGSDLCSLLDEMQHLEKLIIVVTPYSLGEVIDLNFVSSPPKLVRKLHLQAKLNKLPQWVQELQYLVKLTLSWSRLIEDPLKSLQNLPKLLYLCIKYDAYDGECLHFQEGGFQNLKELCLGYLRNLNSIIIDKGAMSSLKKLDLWSLEKLMMVPPGIQYLRKLELLHISGLPNEFKQSIDPEGGQEHWIIQHVPFLDIR